MQLYSRKKCLFCRTSSVIVENMCMCMCMLKASSLWKSECTFVITWDQIPASGRKPGQNSASHVKYRRSTICMLGKAAGMARPRLQRGWRESSLCRGESGSISRRVSTISRSPEQLSHPNPDLWKRCKHPEPCIFRPWFLKFLFNSTFSSHARVWCAPPDGPHKCFVVLHSLFACQASLGLHTSPISISHSFERNGSATFYTDFFDLHDVMCFL